MQSQPIGIGDVEQRIQKHSLKLYLLIGDGEMVAQKALCSNNKQLQCGISPDQITMVTSAFQRLHVFRTRKVCVLY